MGPGSLSKELAEATQKRLGAHCAGLGGMSLVSGPGAGTESGRGTLRGPLPPKPPRGRPPRGGSGRSWIAATKQPTRCPQRVCVRGDTRSKPKHPRRKPGRRGKPDTSHGRGLGRSRRSSSELSLEFLYSPGQTSHRRAGRSPRPFWRERRRQHIAFL